MEETQGLDSKTLMEISLLLSLPEFLRADFNKRKKTVIDLGKEKDSSKSSNLFIHLDKLLESQYDYMRFRLTDIAKIEKAKTKKKPELVVIMHLTRQVRVIEEHMENIRRQRTLLKTRREKDLVLQEIQKEMASEEQIIRKIEYYFESISARNKDDMEKLRKENKIRVIDPIPRLEGKMTRLIGIIIAIIMLIIIASIIWKFIA